MVLKNKIQEDLKEALKAKKEIGTSTLRQLLAVVLNKEKEKRYKIFSLREIPRRGTKQESDLKEEDLVKESKLTDEEIIGAIFSEIKKRKEAILEFQKGNRKDLVDKETKEMEILQKYLPEQLSEEELKKLVKEAIDKTGAKEIKDTGKIMAELMPKVKGKADGNQISRTIKEFLSS